MRRSVCSCKPSFAKAGEVNTWRFIYTPAEDLPKGTRLKFDTMSDGRAIDWEIPSSNLKKKSNVIYVVLEDESVHSMKEVEVPESDIPHYEFDLPKDIEAGEALAIVVGAPKAGLPEKAASHGNACQEHTQRRRTFLLYVDPTGKGHYQDPEIFSLDVRGNELHNIKVIAPSFVTRNKRFDVIVRFEDAYGNLTSRTPEGTLIELTHEHLRENLSWKLFVPETGFLTLPNLYFNEGGIYRIQLKIVGKKEAFFSAPIKCFVEAKKQLFWGLLHGESERYDCTENVENCLRHMRDERALNFFGTSPFEDGDETPNDTWKAISQQVLEFNEIDRFTTFSGVQWTGEASKEGHRILVYSGDSKGIIRRKDTKYTSLRKIYKSFTPKEIISIPSFTMAKGHSFDFTRHNPEYEPVVEIYNAWGSSECSKKAGNTMPITGSGKGVIKEAAEGSIHEALNNNCRFGFVAGGLDDRGIFDGLFDTEQVQYSPGLTGIIAETYSREALFESLHKRACFATTGERIIVGFAIVGHGMGSEIKLADLPGLGINRHIVGYAAGTDRIAKVEIIRNGKVLHEITPKEVNNLDFTYDDMSDLNKCLITPSKGKAGFVYYYLRVTQENGHMAWSSPIWIDA